MNVNDVKVLREDRVTPLLESSEDWALAGRVSKEAIDFLTHQARRMEGVVEKRIELREEYRYLLTLPGVGKILALTMMLETGPIGRFATVGDYVSYCRKRSRASGRATGSARGRATRRTAINIWRGPMQRHRS